MFKSGEPSEAVEVEFKEGSSTFRYYSARIDGKVVVHQPTERTRATIGERLRAERFHDAQKEVGKDVGNEDGKAK